MLISHYYISELHMTMQEKISLLRENETLLKENKRLNQENETMLKNKDLTYAQIGTLSKSLEAMQKDIRDKENMVVPSQGKSFCQTASTLSKV